MHPNLKAFLDMIAVSEGTKGYGDDGYNVIVGYTYFNDYKDHPRKLVFLPNLKIKSSASGRYQITRKNYDGYKKLLKLPDFSPASQDAIAIQMIKEQGAYKDVLEGRIEQAVSKCRNIWASFPNAGYGQREHKFSVLEQAYLKAGGMLA